MLKHVSPISGVAAHGDRYVATAGYDNRIILWDARSKRALARASHDHLANQCHFSPCGNFLVSASSDYTARVWSVPELRLLAVLSDHEDDVEMASFSPDGRLVATASRDHRVRVFARNGTLVHRMSGHGADVISVQWSADGAELVTSSDDGTVRRWRVATGTLIETIDFDDVETDTIVPGPAGVYFAGNDLGQIVAVGAASGRVAAHKSGVKRLVYADALKLLVSLSYDGFLRLWDVGDDGSLAPTARIPVPPVVWMRSLAVAADRRLLLGTFGSSYASYDLGSGEWNLDAVDDTPGVNSAAFISDATWSVGDAGVVRVDGELRTRVGSLCNFLVGWDGEVFTGGQSGELFCASTGEVIYRHHSPLNCGAVVQRQGETMLILGSYTGEGIVLARGSDGVVLHSVVQLHENAVKGIAFAGGVICSVSADCGAAFVDAESLEVIRTTANAHDKIANGVTALGDGRFASVSRDLTLRIWTGGEAERFASPHDHSIKCVSACPDTGLVITGSYSGSVAVFDPGERRWVHMERLTTSGISSVARGRRPGTFLASSYDGAVYHVVAQRALAPRRCAA